MATFEMNEYVRRWAVRSAHSNKWRMPGWNGSHEDLMQEVEYCWSVCNRAYADTVTEAKHMVALFQTTLRNHFHDMAKDIHNPRAESSLDAMLEDGADIFDIASDPHVTTAIIDAPEPIQSILRLLTDDTERILTARFRIYLDGSRDTLNARLHRALRKRNVDVEPHADLLKLVRNYLQRRPRERLYEPTLMDLVAAMVDNYRNPWLASNRPHLCYPAHLAKVAKDKIKAHLKRKAKSRLRMFPIVEVKRCGGKRAAANHYAESGVRQRTPHPKPREQVQEHSRSSVRPRVHGDWKTCEYTRPQQRGDDRGLRCAEVADVRVDSRAVGPCNASMGAGLASLASNRAPPTGPQDRDPTLNPDRRKPRRSRVLNSRRPTLGTRVEVDTRASL